MPTDPTLPPRAQRELKRLATDGVGPTIYQGRTRSQTRQPEHNMSTMGHLGSSTPLPYQHMTNFEKELFHRRIAGVRVPSEVGYEQNEVLRHTVLTQYTLKATSFWATRSGGCLQRVATTTRTQGGRATRCIHTVDGTKEKRIRVSHVP